MAELCRLLLVAGGVSFEDERVEYTEVKKELQLLRWKCFCFTMSFFLPLVFFGKEFSKWKAEGSLPFGQLPAQIDGRVFGQSYSCARYCAKLSGLMGSSPLMAFEIDSIIDATNDIRDKHVKIRYLYRHQTTYEANMYVIFQPDPLSFIAIGNIRHNSSFPLST